MVSIRTYRLLFGGLVVIAALILLAGHLGAGEADVAQLDGAEDAAPPADGITVVATDSNVWLDEEAEGPRQNAELVAFDEDGDVMYYNDTYDRYWDVDPVPGEEYTVFYVASEHLHRDECPATTSCTDNVIKKHNISTGETEELYSRIVPFDEEHRFTDLELWETRWHDAELMEDGNILVADIYLDRIVVIDPDTGIERWAWSAQDEYPIEGGGPFPRDWTHINTVEIVEDDENFENTTYMASLRNQDSVVFVDEEVGYLEDWTLGEDGDRDILFEQHNPDYIPEAQGGPAVVVADSESNRVVEYQRVDGEWEQTWEWSDARMQWPRDADRLPNGNTLITDSHGDRVLEVNPEGEVVWEADVPFPYDAERLGTGPGSTGGESAESLGLESREAAEDPEIGGSPGGILAALWVYARSILPGRVVSGVMYTVPFWVGPREGLAAIVLVGSLVVWPAIEWRKSSYSLALRSPVSLRQDGEDEDRTPDRNRSRDDTQDAE